MASHFEYIGTKITGLRPFSFHSHVTSSVTWPFDSPYPISYSCSIVTKCVGLSPAVFEIFDSKMPDQCKSSLRMRDITWHVPPMQNLGTYFNSSPPHCLFINALWHFYWAPMKNKGCLLLRAPMLNAKSSENFPSPYLPPSTACNTRGTLNNYVTLRVHRLDILCS